jgi:hypothetical protein
VRCRSSSLGAGNPSSARIISGAPHHDGTRWVDEQTAVRQWLHVVERESVTAVTQPATPFDEDVRAVGAMDDRGYATQAVASDVDHDATD